MRWSRIIGDGKAEQGRSAVSGIQGVFENEETRRVWTRGECEVAVGNKGRLH